jgi:hypothetical protein
MKTWCLFKRMKGRILVQQKVTQSGHARPGRVGYLFSNVLKEHPPILPILIWPHGEAQASLTRQFAPDVASWGAVGSHAFCSFLALAPHRYQISAF